MTDTNNSPLSKIGTRGLVVHDGPSDEGDYRFYADNKNQSWRNYPVNIGEFSREHGFTIKDLQVLIAANAPISVLEGSDSKTFFVNMDALRVLEPADPQDGSGPALEVPKKKTKAKVAKKAAKTANVAAESNWYLIREAALYYAVPEDVLEHLENVDAGEAKIVVRRGAVIAAIPNNDIPYGTNCVLVNLTQLLPPEEE